MSGEVLGVVTTQPAGFSENKRCAICGTPFSEYSSTGNPFKWCSQCRVEKFEKLESLAREIKIRKNRRRR